MRIYDIIADKRDGRVLTAQQIDYAVQGFVRGDIPDYQMAALLMAICLRGMNTQETAILTECMAKSGDMVDLSAIAGVKVDKHSTGGVGDKTTLIVAPLAAACGVKIAKMSGRGLGHTGGTVDKLEAIPGYRVELAPEEFIRQVNELGIALVGQSGNLAPADKKIYALRDVTATVENLPLIASSIMSKKLAAGSDAIMLDVKTGGGAFMKTLDDSILLAKAMVDIGEANGRRTAALITDMDTPLGYGIGNSLEVAEAIATLRGEGPEDLTMVCLELCAGMLQLAGKGDHAACTLLAKQAIKDGSGLEKFRQLVAAQGGDVAYIDDPGRFEKAAVTRRVVADQSGYVSHMDTEKIGIASVVLGAGRETKADAIDYAAGLVLRAKTGDMVKAGDELALLYASSEEKARQGEQLFLQALSFTADKPKQVPLIQARVTADGVEHF